MSTGDTAATSAPLPAQTDGLHRLAQRARWNAMVLRGDPSHFDRARWLLRHLKSGDVRTLDAGCGSGAFTILAGLRGKSATGIAFDERDISGARRRAKELGIGNVDFILHDLRRLSEMHQELGQFDQVLLLECIEHIRDDEKLVRDLCRLLRPGGRLLLTTPYAHHSPVWGESMSAEEDGGHVRYGYTHAEIEEMFRRNGLEVVAREFVTGIVSQKVTSLVFALSNFSYPLGWAVTFPLRLLQLLDPVFTKLSRYPYLSIALVGQKTL